MPQTLGSSLQSINATALHEPAPAAIQPNQDARHYQQSYQEVSGAGPFGEERLYATSPAPAAIVAVRSATASLPQEVESRSALPD